MQREAVCKKRYGSWYIAVAMAAVMVLSVIIPVRTVYAEEKKSVLKEDVQKATLLLEKVLQSQYEEKEEELKRLVMEKDYDYTMTMETFYDNGNPFKDLNYLEYFAVYGTIKEYCDLNGIPLGEGLGGVSFLSMDITEQTITEKMPVLVPVYKDNGNGYFELTGNKTITEDTEVSVYEEYESGKYRYAGTEEIKVEEENIVYGEVTLSVISPSMLYEIFGVSKKELEDAYHNRFMKLTNEINNNTLNQSVFIRTRESLPEISELTKEELEFLINQAPENRQQILRTAVSLLGQVPYEFGGKPVKAGYDTSWWTYEGTEQKGLDCSGFVQWTYMTCGYDMEMTDKMISTTSIRDALEDCGFEELEPGDLGLLNMGETTNHTGIYLGDGYFIHCSSGSGTVVVNKFPFRYFKKVEIEKSVIDTDTVTNYYKDNYTNGVTDWNIPDKDVELLSKLIEHEAGNQGYNGWVAVGEVVVNRMESELFPDTLSEVIYEPGQFTASDELSSTVPREGIEQVAKELLNGRLRIFNNKSVLYFRNPMLTNGIPAETQENWGGLKWYTSVGEHAFYLN